MLQYSERQPRTFGYDDITLKILGGVDMIYDELNKLDENDDLAVSPISYVVLDCGK
jgi:hypothetical protein